MWMCFASDGHVRTLLYLTQLTKKKSHFSHVWGVQGIREGAMCTGIILDEEKICLGNV